MKIIDRLTHAWNAFNDADLNKRMYVGGQSSSRPTHKYTTYYRISSYVSSIYNRIAMDVAMTSFKHVRINPENEDITDLKDTGLYNCLTSEANIDQTHIQFIHDLVYSMFDEGVVAVVPVDTSISPEESGGYNIHTMRVGKIVTWFPKHVEVNLYNENTGQNENIIIEKKNVAIVENPLYAVMNDENSTLKRLIKKLNQLDDVDALAASGRLDLLINVPYGIKTEVQKAMAEERIANIERQLASGRNGIAYIDATEKITQINRPSNSQLPETIDKLENRFYNQLGLTQTIFNGTANETELRMYYTRTIDPIVEAIIAEFKRKFLTKTARTQGQTIVAYRDMFKTITVESIGQLSDSFRRNYVASANEIRRMVGLKPSNDPRADELFNPNIADNNQVPKGSSTINLLKDEERDEETEQIEDEYMRE